MQLAAFATASLVLALTPGPGVLFIVARTLAAGRRAGLAAVAGVAAGNLANAVAASLGLAAVFALWPPAYNGVRWAGGGVLLWMAVQSWRRAGLEAAAQAPGGERQDAHQAFWVALLNPKTTLFFAALLPPFLDPAAPAAPQSLALGALFVTIAAATDCGYALAAGALAPRLTRWPTAGARVAAIVFGLLGLYALAG
ncbi:LysE family translocator [Rubrivivax albus]|uniref:LysE family translocator n=1 Tax=Rubrivivax albus TaxID=2499835 RepID=A0A3S2UNK3_9BURK|nr:LysE family translocator [Rubrivivax albus]RVT50056.1 LysE family translocator [Rubrivivax albus]